jgi:hypothetical protein
MSVTVATPFAREGNMDKKFDPKVFQVGYVALATPDLAKPKTIISKR